jgi:hypothetical protein
MTVVNYWSHIPHLRTTETVTDFGPGKLWQVPFDVWDHLTAKAFTDHRADYEATAPVFFYVEADVDWPILRAGEPEERHNIETKKPSFSGDELFDELGLGFLTRFVSTAGWAAQAALTLAAPSAAVGSPRMSMTLCAPDDGYIQIGEMQGVVARVQGDADHEWLLMPESAGEPLDPATVRFASDLFPLADAARTDPDLLAALDALMLVAQPTLDRRQQLLLATIALESLLMPEARSDLADTFRRRLAALLHGSSAQPGIEETAGELYRIRSRALHGQAPRRTDVVDSVAREAVAQRLLAAALLALLPVVRAGADIGSVRAALDRGESVDGAIDAPYLDASAPTPLGGASRLEHSAPSSVVGVFAPGGLMHASDGNFVSWSPLVGLECKEAFASRHGPFFVDSLDPAALMEIEERDIRRDFLAQVGADPTGLPPHAVLGIAGEGSHQLEELRRRRRDAVLALRLAGFWRFVDPALLGWYVYEGTLRTRIPTALRQSVLQGMRHPAEEVISPARHVVVDQQAALVAGYRAGKIDDEIDDEIDGLLDALLSAHPNAFVPGETSAALSFGVIEATLGRFRPRHTTVQLEDLVTVLADDEAASWFRSEGRSFRNSVAHGRWRGTRRVGEVDEENRLLTAIASSAVRELLGFTVARTDATENRIADFVHEMTARL